MADRAADPFLTTAWLLAWWEAFAPGAAGEVLLARRDGALVGGLPLLAGGASPTAMVNDHSPLFRALSSDPSVLRALLAHGLGTGPLRLPALPDEDAAAVARAGWPTIARPGNVSPIVETSGDVAAWRAESKKRWGAPLERFRRKMGRDHEMRMWLNQPPADLERELARGFAVEASGWKGRAGTAILSSPETELFYRRVAESFHARGALVCSGIELDGELVAWDLSLSHASRVFLVKTAFDERFRRLAPGLVLRLSVIEDCFARGLDAHELLGHVDDWKPKFATTARSHTELTVFPRTLRGRVALARGRARRAAAAAARPLRR